MKWFCSWFLPQPEKVPLWASDLGNIMLKVLDNQVVIMAMLNKLRLDQEKVTAIYDAAVADRNKIDDALNTKEK